MMLYVLNTDNSGLLRQEQLTSTRASGTHFRIFTCEPFALASGLNCMPLNLMQAPNPNLTQGPTLARSAHHYNLIRG